MKTSKRVNNVAASSVRKLMEFQKHANNNGVNIIHLNIGQPDIKTPKEFYEGILNQDVLSYCDSQGDKDLINEIIKYYEKMDIFYNYEDVYITTGGSEALLYTLMSICDEGDEIIIPEPFYSNYNSIASMVGVNVVPVICEKEKGFHLPDVNEFKKVLNPKIKAILLSNPCNPTGTVYTTKEVKMLVDFAIENDLYIIADEVYREFIYDDFDTCSFANFSEADQHIIMTDSISKRYSACGARIGAVISKNKNLHGSFLKLCQSRLSVSTIGQQGATALYRLDQSYLNEIKIKYTSRRNLMFTNLNKINGVICQKAEGAFYLMVELPIDDTEHFCRWLLTDFEFNKETIMITPGAGFYKTPNKGNNEVRIAYVIEEELIKRAIIILELALNKYKTLF